LTTLSAQIQSARPRKKEEDMKQITLFLDADDTLWENNIFYEQCMADFVELMATLGFEREEAKHTVDVVERERIPAVGYAPEEFARSLVIAYQRLCESNDQPVQDAVSDRVWEIGRAVLEYPIVLLEDVEETLAHLSAHHRLLLLTKGDREVQQSKVDRSGLSHFFEAVHIVHEKDADVFRDLVARYELRPQQTWMIGNSPRSDINPAVEAGINAIYVPHPNTWELELEQVNNTAQVTVLKSFGELTGLFPGSEQNRCKKTTSQPTNHPHDPADSAGPAVRRNESDD
jgi:putative hydrolase of the HAD superfamily